MLRNGFRLVFEARAWPKAAALLAAAALCGTAYNATSPLGIRFSEAPTAPAPATVYSNATLSIETRPAPPPATTVSYQLDSVQLSWKDEAPAAPVAPTPVVNTPPPAPVRKQPANITWQQAAQLIREQRALVVDARPEEAFRAGHITDAVNLPFIHAERLIAGFKNTFPPGRPIIIYCSDLKCPVSASLADLLLNSHGYQNVRVLAGGYLEWQTASSRANPSPAK